MAVSVCNPSINNNLVVVGLLHENNTPRQWTTSTMSEYDHHEELSINIIIPPKPDGMNPGFVAPRSGLKGRNQGVTDHQQMKGDRTSCNSADDRSSSFTRSIELKTIMNQEEDLAASKLPFVWKLYEMLEDIERNGDEAIVSWVDDGRAFKVHSMKRFVDDIIPKYFRQSKYKSFQRQLYFYDFHRVASGPDAGAYKHPHFVKGVKTMCLSMMPKKNARRRGNGGSSKSDKAAEVAVEQEDATMKEDPEPAARQDPSEWMTQMQSLMTYGADPSQQKSQSRRRSSSASQEQEPTPDQSSALQQRAGPGDGDTVFLFGGKPFHFVEVEFEDIYPPSTPKSSTEKRVGWKDDWRSENKFRFIDFFS